VVDQHGGDLKHMGDCSHDQGRELLRAIDEVVSASRIMQNTYFTSLQTGEMSHDVFCRTQQQFYFAVDYFSRPMSALMMRIPDPAERLGILGNIVEEHGNNCSNAFHEATFRQFLEQIGGNGERPEHAIMGPAVHAFNATIMSACLSDDVRTGIACLGIIEYVFADISAVIGTAIVNRDWVTEENLVHYDLHAKIDKQHAEDFFKLLAADWVQDQGRAEVVRGLKLGAYAFDRLYRDLPADVD
jgi:pyrroloquinoline-quinone synthase